MIVLPDMIGVLNWRKTSWITPLCGRGGEGSEKESQIRKGGD